MIMQLSASRPHFWLVLLYHQPSNHTFMFEVSSCLVELGGLQFSMFKLQWNITDCTILIENILGVSKRKYEGSAQSFRPSQKLGTVQITEPTLLCFLHYP